MRLKLLLLIGLLSGLGFGQQAASTNYVLFGLDFGTSTPIQCTVPQWFYRTDIMTWYGCAPDHVFHAIQPGGGSAVNTVNSAAGNVVITGTNNQISVTNNGLSPIILSLPASVVMPGTLQVTGALTTNVAGGGVQCLHVSNTGLVSGTGLDCGAGGGGGGVTTLNGTAGAITLQGTANQINIAGTSTLTLTLSNTLTTPGNLMVLGGLTTNVLGSTQCLHVNSAGLVSGTGSDCGSGAGGGANTSLSNLSAVSVNTTLSAQSGSSLGQPGAPFQYLYFYGGGTYGTGSYQLTGTPTTTRVLVAPDASGTLAFTPAAGNGIAVSTVNGTTTVSIDSTVGVLQSQLQFLAPNYATCTLSSSTYSCTQTPAPTGFTSSGAPLTLVFVPASSWTGGALTLNNGLGGKSVFQADGTSNPTSTQIVAGVPLIVTYCATCASSVGAWVMDGLFAPGSGTVTTSGSPAAHQVAIFSAASAITGVAVGATNTVLNGSTGADPSFGALPLTAIATIAADSVLQNATGSTAAPTAVAMPTCTSGADLYNTTTHSWSCVVTGTGAPATVLLLSKTANYTSVSGDFSSATAPPTEVQYTISSSTSVTHTLPSTAPALVSSNMPCEIVENNIGSAPWVLLLSTNGLTLDGKTYTNQPIIPGTSLTICSDGSNYRLTQGNITPFTTSFLTITGNGFAFGSGNTANNTKVEGTWLTTPLITSSVSFNIIVADGTNNTDVGIYTGASAGTCTLIAHTGAQTYGSTGTVTKNWTGGKVVIPPGIVYLAMTSAGSTIQLGEVQGQGSPFVGTSTAGTTSGGVLGATITCPTTSYTQDSIYQFNIK